MSRASAALEKKMLQRIAREYRQKGYRIVEHPERVDRPAFLAEFELDMVAYGPKESAVVQVMTRAEMRKDDTLLQLTETIEATPGWQLDLVVTTPDDAIVLDDDARLLPPEKIQRLIATVRQLLSHGEDEAALLLAWSVAEASLRHLAEKRGVDIINAQPETLIEQLTFHGWLSQEDYDLLRDALKQRNPIAHGFSPPQRVGTVTGKLIDTAGELLREGAGSLAS